MDQCPVKPPELQQTDSNQPVTDQPQPSSLLDPTQLSSGNPDVHKSMDTDQRPEGQSNTRDGHSPDLRNSVAVLKGSGHCGLVCFWRPDTCSWLSASSYLSDLTKAKLIQLEVMELMNEGSGLSIVITRGTPGVVVTNVIPGGVAYRDDRLRCGDHILQVNDCSTSGQGPIEVASIFPKSSGPVRLIIGRPYQASTSPCTQSKAHIVPSDQLDKHLQDLNEKLKTSTNG